MHSCKNSTDMTTSVTLCFLLLLAQYGQGFLIGNIFESERHSNDLSTTTDTETYTYFNDTLRAFQSLDGNDNVSLEYRQDTNGGIVAPSSIHTNKPETDLLTANASQFSTQEANSESVTSVFSKGVETSPESLNGTASTSKSSDSITESVAINETTSSASKTSTENNGLSSSDSNEEEKVVIGKPSHVGNETTEAKSKIRTLYVKAVELISDTYTLSILIPVAAGVVFASTIILTIATCRCIKRKCRQRRMRRKVLPDSVKHLRPSDRARLLAESSDEEF